MATLESQDVGRASGETSYGNYSQHHEYVNDSGLVTLPVCGPNPKRKVIRLHGGMGSRIVKWNASKTGSPPLIPEAADTINDKLLRSTVVAKLPVLDVQSNTFRFELSGEYEYAQNVPRRAGISTFPTGSYPFELGALDEDANDLAGAAFQTPPTSPDPTRITPFDVASAYVAATYRLKPEGSRWPFTFVPAYFSAATIVA